MRKVLTLTAGLVLSMTLPVFACGPFFDDSCFTYTLHPDMPLKLYAEGNLGLIQPTYARSYLVAAYRYLKGGSLSAAERDQALKLWQYRLGFSTGDDSDKSQKWLDLRKKTMASAGLKADKTFEFFDPYRQVNADSYSPYLNCPGDAFDTASKTLLAKVSKYGPNSKQVIDWLKNQDKVFCHCKGPDFDYQKNAARPEPEFPQPAPADADPETKRDRAYQIAAAHFYAAQYDKALSLFSAIASDNDSPWQKISAYMTARCLIRKATVDAPKDTLADLKGLAQARVKIAELLGSADMAAYKDSLESLGQFVDLRLSPSESLDKIVARLSAEDARFGKDLDDLIFLFNFAFKEDPDGQSESHTVADKNLARVLHAHEMSDWIWSFTSTDADSLNHALGRYHEKKDLPWLLCVASKLKGKESYAPEIITALEKIDKSSRGYMTATYHLARLLQAQGKDASAVLDAAINQGGAPSAVNALAYEKLVAANNLDDFLRWSYRSPAGIISGADGRELSDDWEQINSRAGFPQENAVLRTEASAAINTKLPLVDFLSAAQSVRVPNKDRKFDFAQAAFCRAFILKNYKAAAQASALLKPLAPQLKSLLDTFDSQTGDSRDFAAAFLILKNPGFKPSITSGPGRSTQFDKLDDYQDNYWDAKIDDSNALAMKFITPAQVTQAKADLKAIEKAGVASTMLGQIVFAYADKHPSDPRVPEALHRLVRATHLSARDNSSQAISKKAHTILHTKYKGNSWTQKTPYFY